MVLQGHSPEALPQGQLRERLTAHLPLKGGQADVAVDQRNTRLGCGIPRRIELAFPVAAQNRVGGPADFAGMLEPEAQGQVRLGGPCRW